MGPGDKGGTVGYMIHCARGEVRLAVCAGKWSKMNRTIVAWEQVGWAR
jgi:hypothetical protein